MSEHRDLEALQVTESQQGVLEQAPGASGELPQAACVPPPYHRQPLPHLLTALSPPHPSSTCRQHAWHPCCTARLHSRSPPRPGSCGFSSWHLWGILCLGLARGDGCWQDQVQWGVSPGFWLGSELLVHGHPLGRREQELPAPFPGLGEHRTAPGSPVPDWRGPVHPSSGWHHEWGGREAAKWPWTPWGAGKDLADQPWGGGNQALCPAAKEPHPTEPQ